MCIFFYIKSKNFDIYHIFATSVIIVLVLPIITYQVMLKYYFLISFPFLIFLMFRGTSKSLKKAPYMLCLFNVLVSISLIIILLIFFPTIPWSLLYEYSDILAIYRILILINFCLFLIYFIKLGYRVDNILLGVMIFAFLLFDFELGGPIIAFILTAISVYYVYLKYYKGDIYLWYSQKD